MAAVFAPVQDWIPDSAWLNVIALGSIDALRNISDSVVKDEAAWRAWYDQEAPERAPIPEYEGRLTKFERMCVVKVSIAKLSKSIFPDTIFEANATRPKVASLPGFMHMSGYLQSEAPFRRALRTRSVSSTSFE